MAAYAREVNLDGTLVPLAVFSYRGLCYSGFVNNLVQTDGRPAAYVASPGRINALKHIISSQDLKQIGFARGAYRDLIAILKLPELGYNFSTLGSLPAHEVSEIALAVTSKTPSSALAFALSIRRSDEGAQLRRHWADRVWASAKSVAVGRNYAPGDMKMENVSAGRDAIQIYCAMPAD
jgi:hypothetical protein